MRKLGRQDVLVRLTTSPQARKKWPQLPETIEARLLTRSLNGKERQVLTSMVDPRCVKPRPQRYSVKKANKNNASQA